MRRRLSMVGAACVLAVSSFAGMDIAPVDTSADRNPSPLQVELKRIGTLRTKREVDDGTGKIVKATDVNTQIMWVGREENKDGFVELSGLDKRGVPSDDFTTRRAVFDWAGAPLEDPVWVDIFTGAVYEIPAKHQIVHSCGITFVRIPAYDSPCLVTERAALDFISTGE